MKIWRGSFGAGHALEREWIVISTRYIDQTWNTNYQLMGNSTKNQLRLQFCAINHTRLILKPAGEKLPNTVLRITKQPLFIAALVHLGIVSSDQA